MKSESILILSDIHADPESLFSVLELAGDLNKFDKKIFLGDSIGYGSKPNDVLKVLAGFDILIMGNHELLAIGEADESSYSKHARVSIKAHMESIGPEGIKFLSSFRNRYAIGNILFFHGAPKVPMEYLFNELNISQVLSGYPNFRLFFGGHLHIPRLAVLDESSGEISFPELSVPRSIHNLDLSCFRYLVNCPSTTPGRFMNKNPGCCLLTIHSEISMTLEFLFAMPPSAG
jgi:hypothetical protein